jgi:hypothetical protein
VFANFSDGTKETIEAVALERPKPLVERGDKVSLRVSHFAFFFGAKKEEGGGIVLASE